MHSCAFLGILTHAYAFSLILTHHYALLREETTLTPDRSILESKEKQIKKLNEKIKALEVEVEAIAQVKIKD